MINIIFISSNFKLKCKAMITNAIICPSLLDTTNIYPIPQPAFNKKYLKNYHNLEMVKKGRVINKLLFIEISS